MPETTAYAVGIDSTQRNTTSAKPKRNSCIQKEITNYLTRRQLLQVNSASLQILQRGKQTGKEWEKFKK